MGAALSTLLRQEGHMVFGIARRDADIEADLGHPDGRAKVVDAISRRTTRVEGVVTCAALKTSPEISGADIVSVNYFGTVELLAGLRPLLERAEAPAALAIGSVGASTRAGPPDVAEACLGNDEAVAR